jgi:hypothetical protein
LALRHLLLLQECSATWISRSILAPERNLSRAAYRDDDEPGLPAAAGEEFEPLSAAAHAFEHALRGRIRRLDSLTVLLAYPYVRHIVLPWQGGLSSSADWQEYARAMFDDQFGGDQASTHWQIVIDPAGFEQPRLAAAIDAALLDGLRILARLHKLRLTSCLSLLAAAVKRYKHMLQDDCVLGLPQPGVLECLFRQQGRWQGVCGMRTLPEGALLDGMAVAAAISNAMLSPPLLLASGATADLPRVREADASFVHLGAAHPWLQEAAS